MLLDQLREQYEARNPYKKVRALSSIDSGAVLPNYQGHKVH